MPLFLSQRDPDAEEMMDDPDCDPAELRNTYRQFALVNSMISRWRYIYRKIIYPGLRDLDGPGSLLDIGFGGGDIPLKLAQWSANDNMDLTVTAIDNDRRAFQFIQERETPANCRFRHAGSGELLQEDRRFDFVVSNHLLHHLDSKAFEDVLYESRKLSRRMVIFNDIKRSDTGYLLFNLLSRPVFRSSFITADGLTSIRRSYTYRELSEKAPEGWRVSRLFPFRLLLTYTH